MYEVVYPSFGVLMEIWERMAEEDILQGAAVVRAEISLREARMRGT